MTCGQMVLPACLCVVIDKHGRARGREWYENNEDCVGVLAVTVITLTSADLYDLACSSTLKRHGLGLD